jgi:hypothetical protein
VNRGQLLDAGHRFSGAFAADHHKSQSSQEPIVASPDHRQSRSSPVPIIASPDHRQSLTKAESPRFTLIEELDLCLT